jgi:hypothetical protein
MNSDIKAGSFRPATVPVSNDLYNELLNWASEHEPESVVDVPALRDDSYDRWLTDREFTFPSLNRDFFLSDTCQLDSISVFTFANKPSAPNMCGPIDAQVSTQTYCNMQDKWRL